MPAMARIPRKNQIQETLTYHIFNRGNAKLDVFHDAKDFNYFINLIKAYMNRFYFKTYNWVLMKNHFHFLICINNPALLSKCFGGLQQAYTQYHHKRWNSAGRLWQGRFKSQPIQKDEYFFECGRYIERNPMKAKLVKYPWDYQWSSCKLYSLGISDSMTTINPGYNFFSDKKDAKAKESEYRAWLLEKEDERFANMDKPVGDEDFIKNLLEINSRLIAKRVRRAKVE